MDAFLLLFWLLFHRNRQKKQNKKNTSSLLCPYAIASIDSIPIYHSISYGLFFFSLSSSFSTIELISIFAGEPQEECMRCGKMYILSSSDISKGACGKCLGIPARDQIKSTPFRSSGESGTEEEEEEDEGEESSNGCTEFSDK